jgi:hypothetical protein
MRSAKASAASDSRMTLGDLTLIAFASASQQVAASPEGASPEPAGRPQEGGGGGAAGGKGGAGGAAEPDVEQLAAKVYQELERLMDIQRERSGV